MESASPARGMVGRLTEKERLELTEFLRAVVEKDSKALVQSLLRMRRPSDKDLDSASKDQLIIKISPSVYDFSKVLIL
jgi:predicted unusual protein kinase regulating ubiquinone biosynthesis (AarF/ABC1/UbiB family)